MFKSLGGITYLRTQQSYQVIRTWCIALAAEARAAIEHIARLSEDIDVDTAAALAHTRQARVMRSCILRSRDCRDAPSGRCTWRMEPLQTAG